MDHTAYCVIPGCSNEYKSHEWGKKKAQRDGWFFSKESGAYCPDHLPGWVPAWRARNASK